MRILPILVVIALSGCGGDDKKVDAAVGSGDTGNIDTNTIDTPAGSFDCAGYCTKIMAACTGTLAQYSTMANCVDSCANFTMGAAADQMGNTLGCRFNHATLAMGDPGTHCVHAGPGGGSVCGATACAGFCSIVVAECPGQWTMQACNSAQNGCPSFNSVPPYKAPSAGDTLECRLYHATMAASDPANHCSHTIANSSVCQ